MSDAGVDTRCQAELDDLAKVDAGGSAAKAHRWDREMGVLAGSDLVHLEGRRHGVLRAATDEADDGRGGGHREAADPGALGDRAVADVRVGISALKAAEVEAGRRLGGGGKPVVAQTADADSEVCSVARHGRHDRASLDAMGGVGHGLAASHDGVQHAEGVVAEEGERPGFLLVRRLEPGDLRRQPFEVEQ